jgi:hypothetical protein
LKLKLANIGSDKVKKKKKNKKKTTTTTWAAQKSMNRSKLLD